MRYTSTFVITLLTFTVLINFSEGGEYKENCIKNTNACVHSAECCNGCCNEGKCVDSTDACLSDQLSGAVGPCALLDPPCPRGQSCVLQPVLCIQNPCPPVPSCVPPDYDDYD